MKSIITQKARRFAGFVSLSPFRIAAFTLHATGLDRIYKPRFYRHSALFELNNEIVNKLPKYAQTMTGGDCDPMNIILIGHEKDIKRAYKQAGWYRANPASPPHVLYGLIVAIFGRSYQKGPFAPLYVNVNLQDMAYQKPTSENNFRQRHHLRVWRTGVVLPDDKPVWVVSASFDYKMRLTPKLPFFVHDISPDLDKERSYVVNSLVDVGAVKLKSVKMIDWIAADKPARNAFGSKYYTDGRAAVVEI